jgi:hypothetical protein
LGELLPLGSGQFSLPSGGATHLSAARGQAGIKGNRFLCAFARAAEPVSVLNQAGSGESFEQNRPLCPPWCIAGIELDHLVRSSPVRYTPASDPGDPEPKYSNPRRSFRCEVFGSALGKKERTQTWELARMHCFTSGSFPIQYFFSPNSSSNAFIVTPNTALTVSFVTKDPRNYSVLCSLEGCSPKGMIRYSVTVNATDFVFVWPGRDVVYCGR